MMEMKIDMNKVTFKGEKGNVLIYDYAVWRKTLKGTKKMVIPK